MSHDTYIYRRKLIERKNRENAYLHEDVSFKWIFWIVGILALMALFVGGR